MLQLGDEAHITRANEHFMRRELGAALAELDLALALRESASARWKWALVLLSLGRYADGFADMAARWQLFAHLLTARGQELIEKVPRWRYQKVAHKRLVVLHEQGFGDTIMMLRFIPQLQTIGAYVTLQMPPALQRLAAQLAPLERGPADMCAPLFDVVQQFKPTPQSLPTQPYLKPDKALVETWRRHSVGDKRRIGIAWSTKYRDSDRTLDLDAFLKLLDPADGDELTSLQTDDGDRARARGVRLCKFADFADVTAVASTMDLIVSIDTAAVHVAGAIGHPNVHVMLPYAPNWRWLNGSWYPAIRQHRQQKPGDWASAFAQLKLP